MPKLKINAPWIVSIRDGWNEQYRCDFKYSPSAFIQDGKGKSLGIEIHLTSVGYSGTKKDRAQDEQLAQAISAIPDLLDALSSALINEGQDACCLPFGINPCHCWRCQARRAITKAIGK